MIETEPYLYECLAPRSQALVETLFVPLPTALPNKKHDNNKAHEPT